MMMQWEISRLPPELQGDILPLPFFKLEFLNRFLLLMSVALLFDLRDVEIDADLGVKTFANTYRKGLPIIVYTALLVCAFTSTKAPSDSPGTLLPILLPIAYVAALPIAYRTLHREDEDWYAIAVDGILLLPPLAVLGYRIFP